MVRRGSPCLVPRCLRRQLAFRRLALIVRTREVDALGWDGMHQLPRCETSCMGTSLRAAAATMDRTGTAPLT